MAEEDKVPYQYILIRKDLPIEVQMINIAHASGESVVEAPIPSTTVCVLLHIENENALLEWEKIIRGKEYSYVLIREPDEPYNNAAMSIGLAPSIKRNQLRKLFYHLSAVKIN
jgi:hypothetical protein